MPPGRSSPTSRTPGGSPDGPLALPLPLEPAGPRPARIEPEGATPCAEAFDHPDWRFSVDWQGMRAVLCAGADGAVRIHDQRLRDVTGRLPEVVAAARAALRGRAATLDGVVAVLDAEGCPDLPALAARLWAAPAGGRSARAGRPPAVLLVTDLVHLDGAALTAWPFDRRREVLAAVLEPAPHLQLPDWVCGQGRALAAAAAQRCLPAVLARHRSAPYHPGAVSPQRLRIAVRDETDAAVTGLVGPPAGAPQALLLAEWDGARWLDAGRVRFTGDPAVARWLAGRSGALRRPDPAGDDLAGEAETGWLRPSLVATVRHHGRGDDGRLRLPSLVALRDDVEPRRCLRRAPAAPPPAAGTAAGAPFRPTVITTLPFGVS